MIRGCMAISDLESLEFIDGIVNTVSNNKYCNTTSCIISENKILAKITCTCCNKITLNRMPPNNLWKWYKILMPFNLFLLHIGQTLHHLTIIYFAPWHTFLYGRSFNNLEEIENGCREFFASKNKEWYCDGVKQFANRWFKAIYLNSLNFET